MTNWLIEHGIGETRMVRVEGDDIIEARIHLEGTPRAGTGRQAVLKSVGPPAIASDGTQEFLLPDGAAGTSEGAALLIEVTREPIPGPEPWKRPLAKVTESIATSPLEGEILPFPAPDDRLGAIGWDDLLEEARSGVVRFAGGELRIFVTAAMTLIDVDGTLPPAALALAGAEVSARAIMRHGVGGSIGVDFPTIAGKAQRQAIAQRIDRILPQPFERTAVNGFGFLQIVRPRRHASTFEVAADRAAFEARALLRRAAFEAPGPKCLVAHPAVVRALEQRPHWLDALARQGGGMVGLRADSRLPMSGGYAES